MNNDGFQMVVNKRKSGKTGSTIYNRSGDATGKATWEHFKQKVSYEPKALGNLPKNGASKVSNYAKDDPYKKLSATKGGLHISTSKPSVPTSNPYDVRDDMESEEEADVVYDESVIIKDARRRASPFMALDAFMSTSKRNDSILWHARWGHVYFKMMQDMSKDSLILAFDMDTEKCNNTWVLADLPSGCKPLGCKWIFKRKLKTTFLNGELEDEVYMNQPQGFIMPSNENKVCKLIKSVYGLKQTPMQWHQKFDEVVLSNGYLLNQADKCIHRKFDKTGILVIKVLYEGHGEADVILVVCEKVTEEVVAQQPEPKLRQSKRNRTPRNEAINDEMDSIIGNNTWVLADLPSGCKPLGCKWIFKRKLKTTFLNGKLEDEVYMNQPQGFIMPSNENKEFLSSKFFMKDMGEADVILVSTPIDTSEKLMPNNGQAISQHEYSRVIGCLMYVMTCIRLDIAFAVDKLSRYTKGYTGASWISNTKDNSSTSRWLFLLDGGAISFSSKKQTCITSSTIEYESVALAVTGKEAKWLRNLILKIPLWSKPVAPISTLYDGASTLSRAYSLMYIDKSRHLGFRHNMIRELIMNGVVSIEFVRSQQNLADHLTKGLAKDLVI
nr:zinc finger, CCHC-type [Tanacetum cinerariifolium]